MGGILFWDVDTQVDFLKPEGKLFVPGSEAIIANLARLTQYAHERKIRIIASANDHFPDHRELSDNPDYQDTFPPHCMHGTEGQRRIPETALVNPLVIEPDHHDSTTIGNHTASHLGDILFLKHRFDVFTNPNVLPVLRILDPAVIVVYGVTTDICGRYTVEGLTQHRPHTRLYFVTDAARAIRSDVAEHLLKEWAEEGVRLVKSAEILEEGVLDKYLASSKR
jgi:nicotinamidase/pyrazinamidase